MGDDAGIGTADRGWRLADRNTARGLDDAGIGTAVGAGVGAAVGDGIDTAVGDESGKVVGDGSSTVVGDGIGMGDDAGIGTADRGWRLADRNTARGLDDAGIGTAVGAGVGAAVGDGIDTAVGDESGKVVGDGSSPVVGGRSVGPQRRLAICILRAGVFTLLLVADSLPGRAPQHEGTTVPKGVSRVAWGIPTEDRRRTAWLTSLEGPIAPTTVSLATFCCCDVRDRLRRECACPCANETVRDACCACCSDETFRRKSASGTVVWLVWEVAHPSDETFRRKSASDTVVWLVWEVAHPSDETFRRKSASDTRAARVGDLLRGARARMCVRMGWSELASSLVAPQWSGASSLAARARMCVRRVEWSGASCGVVVRTRRFGRRPQTLVWLVWEAPSDETFRPKKATDTRLARVGGSQ